MKTNKSAEPFVIKFSLASLSVALNLVINTMLASIFILVPSSILKWMMIFMSPEIPILPYIFVGCIVVSVIFQISFIGLIKAATSFWKEDFFPTLGKIFSSKKEKF